MLKDLKEINIAFSTKDDEYVNYMIVTMLSVVLNNKNCRLNFYILISLDFSDKSKQYLKNVFNRYKNVKIIFLEVDNSYDNVKLTHDFINLQTYYRLSLPDLLPLNVNRCLYLDTDVIVNGDLINYFSLDIEDYYFAGVVAAGYLFSKEYNEKRLLLPDISTYTNAGVILMNIEKMRQDGLTSKFKELLSMNYHDQDQDILNVSCYNKILNIPLKYNLMTKYEKLWDKCVEVGAYSKSEIEEALSAPVIIHYADKIKPWDNKEILFSKLWWDYAKKTPVYKKIKKRYETKILQKLPLLKSLFSIEKTDKKRILHFMFLKISIKRKSFKLKNLFRKKCKMFVVYHKPFTWVRNNLFYPIQTGRAEFRQEYLRGHVSSKEFKLMLKSTIGDDTGDNISNLGKYLCELTCMYWVWKNYKKIGNPQFVGFPHYRRFLMFENNNLQPLDNNCISKFNVINKTFLRTIGSVDRVVSKHLETHDFVCAKPQDLNDTVYNHYLKNHKTQELDLAIKFIEKKYPEIYQYTEDYLNQNEGFYLNLFVMKKDLFFNFCEFLFDVVFYVMKQDVEMEKRAFFSERVIGIYLNYLIKSGRYKYELLPVALVKNP